MKSNFILSIFKKSEVDVTNYQKLIRSLIYAIMYTYTDILYTVGIIACHVVISSEIHLNVVKCIFCYLYSVSNYKIIYQTEKGLDEQIVYSDLNWAEDHDDCKSTTGFLSCLARNLII